MAEAVTNLLWHPRSRCFPRVGVNLNRLVPKKFRAEVEESTPDYFSVTVRLPPYHNVATFSREHWERLSPTDRERWLKRDLKAVVAQFKPYEEKIAKWRAGELTL